MKLCMWRHTAPRNCGWVCAAKGSEQERKVLYAIASLDKPSSRKEITNFIEMCNLGLSGGVVGVLFGRLLEKRLLAKPDKYQYGLTDKLFREYILRYRGYDGSGAVPG